MKGLARCVLIVGLAVFATEAPGQSLYKYRGADGEWVFTDRKPGGSQEIEVRELSRGEATPNVRVFYQLDGGAINLFAANEYHAPVQVVIGLDEVRDVTLADPEHSLRFVVPARESEFYLMSFEAEPGAVQPLVAYRYLYVLGDPEAVHRPDRPYRAPFAVAGNYKISQAYPFAITHTTRDSAYAVDIAMPIGTDVHAARGGTVFEVAGNNFRSGTDAAELGSQANVVRILHEDGTHAIYAHLNWNTIRVRPGDVVERGEYIADSGNTGFSTGPHLHFAVMRNADMRAESVPIVFEGPNGQGIVPELGDDLTAY